MSKWKKELVIKIKMLNKDIFVTSAVKSKGKRGRNAMGQFWTIPKDWRTFCKFEEFSKGTSALILKTKSFRYIFLGTYMSSDKNKNNSYSDELTIINNAIEKFRDLNTKIIIMGDFNARLHARYRSEKKSLGKFILGSQQTLEEMSEDTWDNIMRLVTWTQAHESYLQTTKFKKTTI